MDCVTLSQQVHALKPKLLCTNEYIKARKKLLLRKGSYLFVAGFLLLFIFDKDTSQSAKARWRKSSAKTVSLG